jgi:hypothetical protein
MAKNIVYFLTIDVLKKNTIIDNNIEQRLIYPALYEAQEIELQEILGTDLYVSLQNKISGSTLSGDYKTLVDNYIFDFLLNTTMVRLLPNISTKIKNSGFVQETGQQSSYGADKFYYNEMKNKYRDLSEHYSNLLKKHLYNNSSKYSEYTSTTCDKITPNRNDSYFSGMVL